MSDSDGGDLDVKRAMVLAAGYGKRLEPLTHILPKPLLPVCNRPVVEHTLRLLNESGFREVVVNLHHKGQAIVDRLGDGSRFGVNITYSPEEELLGTAGGIKAAERHLGDGPFLIINSDILINIDLSEVWGFHREKNGLATLVLRREEAQTYGAIKIDSSGRVVQFLSTPSKDGGPPAMEAMFTGVQVLNRRALERIPEGRHWDSAEELYPVLMREGASLYGYIMGGEWIDMGTPKRYLEANFLAMNSLFFTAAGEREDTGVRERPGVHPAVMSEVGWKPPILLGEGCMLEEGSVVGPNLVMGDGCRVGRGARIDNCVVWEGVEIGRDSSLKGSILTGGVNIPPRSVIEESMVVRDRDGVLSFHPI